MIESFGHGIPSDLHEFLLMAHVDCLNLKQMGCSVDFQHDCVKQL
jgi:hypothetical protein